jgi:polyadenylation factor subunit 2
MIPGMGPEDKVEMPNNTSFGPSTDLDPSVIPGLDFDSLNDLQKPTKKVPYAKPIPKNFQAQWNETKSEFCLIFFLEMFNWIFISR